MQSSKIKQILKNYINSEHVRTFNLCCSCLPTSQVKSLYFVVFNLLPLLLRFYSLFHRLRCYKSMNTDNETCQSTSLRRKLCLQVDLLTSNGLNEIIFLLALQRICARGKKKKKNEAPPMFLFTHNILFNVEHFI